MKKRTKTFLIIGAILLITFSIIYSINYFQFQSPMDEIIERDHRNAGLKISVHYKSYILFSTLIFDLKEVTNCTKADIFRAFLQYAEKIQKKDFKNVELCYHGKTRFIINGNYFHTIGAEYAFQNPVYTMRTFPENLLNPDGTQAYSGWTGGWLAVMTRQMQDFNECIEKWCSD